MSSLTPLDGDISLIKKHDFFVEEMFAEHLKRPMGINRVLIFLVSYVEGLHVSNEIKTF